MRLLAYVYAFVYVLVCVSVVEFITDESRTCGGCERAGALFVLAVSTVWGQNYGRGLLSTSSPSSARDQHEGGGNMGDVGDGVACHRGWE